MKLPQFMYLPPGKDNPELGAGLILSTTEPFYLGKVYRFKSDAESMNFLTEKPPLVYSNVLGYGIYIVFYGSLTQKLRVSGTEWKEELQQVFDRMAEFYDTEKIAVKRSFYRKFEL